MLNLLPDGRAAAEVLENELKADMMLEELIKGYFVPALESITSPQTYLWPAEMDDGIQSVPHR
ncbi:MAG: hypothetical protein GXP63_03495 [DPANN group archaeon]|nr:hypothetical protein [DPANN group archaeon]